MILRHLLNLLGVASLLLLLAAVVLSVRSHFAAHEIVWPRPDGTFVARLSQGRVSVFGWTSDDQRRLGSTQPVRHTIEQPSLIRTGRDPWVERYWHTPVFTFRSGKSPAVGMTYWDFIIPCWVLAAFAAPLPAYVFLRERNHRRRTRRAQLGQCSRCGYDLRATPGRCPECGADAPPQTPDPRAPLRDG